MNIRLDHITFKYDSAGVSEKPALRDISLSFEEGEFIAVAGGTGSGKSTLLQLLNGLRTPSEGKIFYDGVFVGDDRKAMRNLRLRIGLVFQYPEYQLFDETVIKDVSFGPLNQGLNREEALERSRKALRMTGLREEIDEKSPFDLSGGEKRRAAIAGILAMEPEVLMLDEPTAGLDPEGKEQILELLRKFHEDSGKTVIMVSHNMDEIAEYASRVIVLKEGAVLLDGSVREVFAKEEVLKDAGLSLPQVKAFCKSLGLTEPVTMAEAVSAICKGFKSECFEISH